MHACDDLRSLCFSSTSVKWLFMTDCPLCHETLLCISLDIRAINVFSNSRRSRCTMRIAMMALLQQRSYFRLQRLSISTGKGLDGFNSLERTEQVRWAFWLHRRHNNTNVAHSPCHRLDNTSSGSGSRFISACAEPSYSLWRDITENMPLALLWRHYLQITTNDANIYNNFHRACVFVRFSDF